MWFVKNKHKNHCDLNWSDQFFPMNIIRGELLFLFCPEFSISSFTLHLQKSLYSFSGKRLAHNYTIVFSRYTFYLVFLLSSFLQVSSKLDAPAESDGSSGSRCFPSADLGKHICGRNRSVSASTLSSQGGQAMGWGGPLVIREDPAVVITSSVSVAHSAPGIAAKPANKGAL